LKRRAALFAALVLVLGLALTRPASAHVFTFTETKIFVKTTSRVFTVEMTSDLDAMLLGADPAADPAKLAAAIRALPEAERLPLEAALERTFKTRVRVRFDGQPAPFEVSFPERYRGPAFDMPPSFLGTVVELRGEIPPGARTLTFWASRSFPEVRLEVWYDGRSAMKQILPAGEESAPFPVSGAGEPVESRWRTALRYLELGYTHILPKGTDHMLFVLGLFLLSTRLKPLLVQVSLFTLAHTATLALSTLGVVRLPPSVVEPLIALSIAYVAIENTLTSEMHAWRGALVFGFGLLHGLGFAGVLGELGLPREAFLTALLSFNAGVEVGQLTVLAAAFAALGAFRRRPWYRRAIVVPLSILIAMVGLYWTVTRALTLR